MGALSSDLNLTSGDVMPWTGPQHRLFEAAASNPAVAARVGIPQQKAAQMASEGVKRNSLAQALRKK
jgi:alkylated DNA repair dioxygenase AlkB